MMLINKRHLKFLLASALVILLSIPAVIFILNKADLPISVHSSQNSIFIEEIKDTLSGLKINDRIISVEEIPVFSREEIEVIMDSKNAGDVVIAAIQRDNEITDVPVRTTNFYSAAFVIFQAFTILIFIMLGWFVLVKSPDRKPAELFNISMVGAAAIMIMTWGRFDSSFNLSHITRIIFHLSYIFTPVVFVHLSLAFPSDKTKRYRWLLQILYSTGLVLSAATIYAFINTARNLNSENIVYYIKVYNLCRYFIALNVLISISVFIVGYIRSENRAERKKIKWLITGFIAGPMAFIVLWVLPQAFTDYAFIPEGIVYFLMLAVPISFAISIVKYHLMDIDFIINRGIVYSILTACIFFSYLAIVVAVTGLFKEIDITLVSGFTAVFVAFLFNPIKNYVKSFVDKRFFRIQYNYREAVKKFYSGLKEINDISSLANELVIGVNDLIPAEKTALIYTEDINKVSVPADINFGRDDFIFLTDKILKKQDLMKNIINPDKVEPGITSCITDEMLKEIKISVVIVSSMVNGKILFVLAAGNKKSGSRYSAEDIDLLQDILNTAASVAARIKLQEDLIIKNLEARKLQELNEQKSLFVSTVSHELKTPLTSIKMYSELIRMKEDSEKEKINHYADYIEGESERLTRLINNVLSYSRIEKGIKKYYREPVNLNEIVNKAVSIMEYQVKIQNFALNSYLENNEMTIFADADALLEVFINLISNGIKYSPGKKQMNIYTASEDNNYTVTFQDSGIGMSEDDQKNLFSPFFRSERILNMKIPGTGLGLTIIKHTADAHNIEIQVQSKLSEGTSIKLIIPKFRREDYEEYFID